MICYKFNKNKFLCLFHTLTLIFSKLLLLAYATKWESNHELNKNLLKQNPAVIADYTCTNTKSLAKEFSKILIFEYFGYLRMGLG